MDVSTHTPQNPDLASRKDREDFLGVRTALSASPKKRGSKHADKAVRAPFVVARPLADPSTKTPQRIIPSSFILAATFAAKASATSSRSVSSLNILSVMQDHSLAPVFKSKRLASSVR